MITYFFIAAIIESFQKVSQKLNIHKYFARAKVLFENDHLFKRNETFKQTRFIIKVQKETISHDCTEFDHVRDAILQSQKARADQEAIIADHQAKSVLGKITNIKQQQQDNKKMSEKQHKELKNLIEDVKTKVNDEISNLTMPDPGFGIMNNTITQTKNAAQQWKNM